MHVSFKIHYRNNLIDKKHSYLIPRPPSWNDRNCSYGHQLYPSVIGKWLKVFFGLSFLKDEEVEDAIAFDIFSSLPEDERAVSFADYVLKNYAQHNGRGTGKYHAFDA